MDAVTATVATTTSIAIPEWVSKVPGTISSIAGAGWPAVIIAALAIIGGLIGFFWLQSAKDHARHTEEQTAQNQDQASNAAQASTLDQNAAKAENDMDNTLKD